MKKIGYWQNLTLSIVFLAVELGYSAASLAQIRGEGPRDFFERGSQQMEQEVERMQREGRQQEEGKNESALEIKTDSNEDSQAEDNPPLPINNDDNVPNPSPE